MPQVEDPVKRLALPRPVMVQLPVRLPLSALPLMDAID
jgi:hypothetical protein